MLGIGLLLVVPRGSCCDAERRRILFPLFRLKFGLLRSALAGALISRYLLHLSACETPSQVVTAVQSQSVFASSVDVVDSGAH